MPERLHSGGAGTVARGARTAIQFLTRLPLPAWRYEANEAAAAAYFFSLVGLALGAVLAALELVLRPHVELLPRLMLVWAVSTVATGGLHLDGLADTADGWGAWSREQALTIMRDSRIGSFGVLALVFGLGLQLAALASLPLPRLSWALLLAPGWGRASLVLAAAIGPSARESGAGATFIDGVRLRHVAAALTTMVVATLLVLWRFGVPLPQVGMVSGILLGITLVTTLGWTAWCRKKLGGQTGDTLGATQEAVVTAVLWTLMVLR
ncbi:MAG: adenosylcobinamide-GDP ribazoletransferase [Terriglobales bacterium]